MLPLTSLLNDITDGDDGITDGDDVISIISRAILYRSVI